MSIDPERYCMERPDNIKVLPGATFSGPPEGAGEVVSMIEYQGVIYVACQWRVYRLLNGQFHALRFVVENEDGEGNG